MKSLVSPNTQAILLLTAPLLSGNSNTSPDLLSPKEYKYLAQHLRKLQCQPADLLLSDAEKIFHACNSIIEKTRLERLIARGFLLSQVVERWQARAIWVISRADINYPKRLKNLLREDAPAILYGCGDIALLEYGGLAVVGSRNVDNSLIDYTLDIGNLAATSGKNIISGGAKGIDQAAMFGAIRAGGTVCGVLSDNLEKTVMNRDFRSPLLAGKMVLISPYDPIASFNVGNAMQRNKLIYGLADASLVINSDFNKGGTWAGAKEYLSKFKYIPVYVRSIGEPSIGLDELKKNGALPWPNPENSKEFNNIFSKKEDNELSFDFREEVSLSYVKISKKEEKQSLTKITEKQSNDELLTIDVKIEESPSEVIFSAVRLAIGKILKIPMKENEIASILGISNVQTKVWLQRLIVEKTIEKLNKPIRYIARNQDNLF
jgi:predicted Rossmann fold nucleotide-binding protein DprA/Smf involved in DNA uptake